MSMDDDPAPAVGTVASVLGILFGSPFILLLYELRQGSTRLYQLPPRWYYCAIAEAQNFQAFSVLGVSLVLEAVGLPRWPQRSSSFSDKFRLCSNYQIECCRQWIRF